MEAVIREQIENSVIADTSVDVRFERFFPPMPFRPQSLPLAEHAQRVYPAAGGTVKVNTVSIGAGTDAAFAAINTEVPVLEGLGLQNFGAHSNDAEYVRRSSRACTY